MKKNYRLLTLSFAFLALGTYVQRADGAVLLFTFSGEVGSDPNASYAGTQYGNSGWFFNSTPLVSGTEIIYEYRISDGTLDSDLSSSLARFDGGDLTVKIPSLAFVGGPTSEAMSLYFQDGAGSDSVFVAPTDFTGAAVVGLWADGTNPWGDVNTLSLIDTDPPAGAILGTSPNSDFNLNFVSGDRLSTSNSELLVNPSVSSSSVPEPSTGVLILLAAVGTAARRYRSN